MSSVPVDVDSIGTLFCQVNTFFVFLSIYLSDCLKTQYLLAD